MDGLVWVYGPGEEPCAAFTSDDIDHLKGQIAFYKEGQDLPPDS